MTENPPPPAEPTEPELPPRRSVFPPAEPRPDTTTGFAEVVGRAVLGIVTFVIAVVGYTMLMSATEQPAVGAIAAVVVVAALFAIRKRSGPSPLLGAVTVGASVALVVFGGCTLLIYSLK